MGTSVWQAGQVCVNGCEGAVAPVTCGLSEEPQCIQKAAPGLTSSLQRGQTFGVAATTDGVDNKVAAAGGVAASCTGVPQCWQNFFPVTSAPQDAQVAIDGPSSCNCQFL